MPSPAPESLDALVIGAGPAGLMAAEQLALAGRSVVVLEAMPSPARKFLMAGKSGLNLSNNRPQADFERQYGAAAAQLRPMLRDFDAEAIREWAQALGQPTFVGSSGQIFPQVMKASPLLRAWLARLADRGVQLRRRWRWQGFAGGDLLARSPVGEHRLSPKVCVLALGGASWSRLGSDGHWAPWLAERGVEIAAFKPANAGLRIDWSEPMRRHLGQPIKHVRLGADALRGHGDCMPVADGLEGSALYRVSAAVREGADLWMDLFPDLDRDTIAQRLCRPRGKASQSKHLRKTLGLTGARLGIFYEFAGPDRDPEGLARQLKQLPLRHVGLKPLDQAISTAGGVRLDAVDDNLMLHAMPGVFCAGEMLDWEAPTGGYLLTACLATGRWAGAAAARYCAR